MLTTLANTKTAFADLTDGLVAYYPFNGNADDESGNGNNGTVYGATLTTDRFGNTNKAYSFDGVDDYISVPELFDSSIQTFTISTWALTKTLDDNGHHLFYKTPSKGEFALLIDTGNKFSMSAKLDNAIWYSSTGTVNKDTFVHLVGIYDKGNNLALWVDGIEVSKVSIPNNNLFVTGTSYPSAIGAYTYTGFNRFWNGKIDEVRIYNRALSESEIQELYKEGTTPTVTASPTPTPSSTTTPPTSWVTNPANGHKYKLTYSGTWEECESDAVYEGAHLVTINDADEQNWLVATFGGEEPYWIGFTDKNRERYWEWISGEEETYTNWYDGEPNNCGGDNCEDEDYAVMDHGSPGKWNDIPGTETGRAIMEKVTDGQTPTPSPSPSPTPTEISTGYISGRVTDANTGSGISGATVSTDSGGYSATTDSIGSYQISNVATGSYTLTASATGYDSDSQSITVTASTVTTADFSLTAAAVSPSTGVISGAVLDANTGKGISGATVSTGTGGYSATTNSSGSYTISNIIAGNYTLTSEADGYEAESQDVTVTANALSTVNFSLEPSASTGTAIVFGSVEDEYGDYFQGVDVTISEAGYSDETETDEYGDYELYEVPAGSYTITFEAKGYETQSVTITVDAGDEYEVDTVRMEPEGEDLGLIYGYVYDIEGEPVEDVKITAKYISTGAKEQIYTDRDGFFEFEDMEPGTYKVSTKKKGYKKAKETVTLKSEQEKYVEFELRESSRSRLITALEEMFGY